MNKLISNIGSTLLLIAAIFSGSFIGWVSPATGTLLSGWVDYAILTLVSLLFFEVRFETLAKAGTHLRFLSIAWGANFLLIPVIGYLVASLFLTGQPLFFTGLLIYFLAPCTDWFLGFTRLARGNTSLGTVLLPINLITQLLLYPVYLALFAGTRTGVEIATLGGTLLHWFLIPLACAIAAHLALRAILPPRRFEAILTLTGKLLPLVIAVLVLFIFSANIGVILEHLPVFLRILVAVFLFFIATYFLGEGIAKVFKLAYPEHALLTMTIAARNAPLMLGVTAAAFPDQPLIYAALVIGMLVEFPHLTALKHLLLRRLGHPLQSAPRATSGLVAGSQAIPDQA